MKKFLWRISIATSVEAEEAVTELLAQLSGQSASSYVDAETQRTVVSAYFTKKPAQWLRWHAHLRDAINRIRRSGLNTSPAKISLKKIPHERWAHSWKRHFKPLEIGLALLVKPSWIRRKPRKGQSVVVLDPGLSFGTGQHPTTEFCLRQIVKKSSAARVLRSQSPKYRGGENSKSKIQSRKYSLLDMGSGSGILAICAAKMGFSPVHAFDFDPESVRVANANARQNGVRKKIRILQQDLTKLPKQSAPQYDVICANLISTLLIAERERIVARLKPGGTLILAGILKKEFAAVEKAYASCGLRRLAAKSRKEWRSGAFIFANVP